MFSMHPLGKAVMPYGTGVPSALASPKLSVGSRVEAIFIMFSSS